METSLYVSLSGQIALQRRLDTIANNVANSSTTGFRGENVTFESLLSRGATTYASVGHATFSTQAGQTIKTDNPLDVAIQGDGYLSIAVPGGIAYTRDGRMRVSTSGNLETLEGYPVLDTGGAPIQISPSLGAMEISKNGAINQNGGQVASIGLFRLPADAALSRGPGVSLISNKPADPVIDFKETSLLQGVAEGANVNPMLEMSKLISVTRAFEALSAAMDQSHRQMNDAIRSLSGSR